MPRTYNNAVKVTQVWFGARDGGILVAIRSSGPPQNLAPPAAAPRFSSLQLSYGGNRLGTDASIDPNSSLDTPLTGCSELREGIRSLEAHAQYSNGAPHLPAHSRAPAPTPPDRTHNTPRPVPRPQLVVLEVLSDTACHTGLSEEAEWQWKRSSKTVMAPCQNIKHVFQRTARNCPDAVFLEHYADDSDPASTALCKRLGIDFLPSLVFFKDNQIVWRKQARGPPKLAADLIAMLNVQPLFGGDDAFRSALWGICDSLLKLSASHES